MTSENAKVVVEEIMANPMTDDHLCIIRDALTAYFDKDYEPPKAKAQETNISDIQVQRMYRFETDSPLKAFIDIVINDALLIKGVRVMDGKKGLFVSMPREQAKDAKWYDTIRCLTQEVRDQITEVCLSAYNEE